MTLEQKPQVTVGTIFIVLSQHVVHLRLSGETWATEGRRGGRLAPESAQEGPCLQGCWQEPVTKGQTLGCGH